MSLKDWKQPLSKDESIYILITEKKAILANTFILISNSRKEIALIADKTRIMPALSQFAYEYKTAIKNGTNVRLLFEGESTFCLEKKWKNILVLFPSRLSFIADL